jgi:hypothetical protein
MLSTDNNSSSSDDFANQHIHDDISPSSDDFGNQRVHNDGSGITSEDEDSNESIQIHLLTENNQSHVHQRDNIAIIQTGENILVTDTGRNVRRRLSNPILNRESHSQSDLPIDESKIFLKDAAPYFTLDEKPTTNYVGLCDTMMKNIEHMKQDNKNTNPQIDELIASMSLIKSKLSRLIEIGKNINSRDIMIGSFCNTVNNILGYMPSTKGSFDRKCVESVRALEDLYDDDVYGNPIGSEITFNFGSNAPIMIGYMELLRKTTDRPVEKRILFGKYRLDRVHRANMNAVMADLKKQTFDSITFVFDMIMTATDTNISILCHAICSHENGTKFRIENIDCAGYEIFNSLNDLIVRRAVSNTNYTKLVRKLTQTMTRQNRSQIWNDILNFLDSDMNIIQDGYRYVDAGDNFIFKISREDNEPCQLTCIDPPYINIHMFCGHALSLPSVYGLVNEGASQDTESIKCPLCRKTLIPTMIPAVSEENKKKFEIKIYSIDDFKDTDSDCHITMEKNVSRASRNVSGIAKLKSSMITTGETENDQPIEEEATYIRGPAMQLMGRMISIMQGQNGSNA